MFKSIQQNGSKPTQTRRELPHLHGDGGFTYVISGLRVWSEMELPSALQRTAAQEVPDVVLRAGEVPAKLPGVLRAGTDWQATETDFLLLAAGVARFAVRSGSEVVYQREPGGDPADIALFLVGTCLAIILQQRGRVVLHASAVLVGGKAMLFCGPSGAGKSTLAATLAARGYPLMNDDVCGVMCTQTGDCQVHPDGRLLKLWEASLAYLAPGEVRRSAVRKDTPKFYYAPECSEQSAHTVGGVFILRVAEADERASLQRLSLASGTKLLMENAYRPTLIHAMEVAPRYFSTFTALQRAAGVFQLSRRMEFGENEAAIRLLEETWSGAASLEGPVAAAWPA